MGILLTDLKLSSIHSESIQRSSSTAPHRPTATPKKIGLLDKGIGHWNTFFFYMKMSISALAFYWRNDIHNLGYLTVFIPNSVYCGICRRQCYYEYGILKVIYRILCKTEGSRPYLIHFSMTNKCFDSTQKYI